TGFTVVIIRLAQLVFAYLADISESMCKHLVVRVSALWLQFDFYLRVLVFVSLYPGSIGRCGVGLDQDWTGTGAGRLHLLQQRLRICPQFVYKNTGRLLPVYHIFLIEHYGIGGAAVYEHAPFAIQNSAARGGDGNIANTIVLGLLDIVFMLDYL